MASLGNTTFKGKSGKDYRFKAYPWGTRFRKLSGVYLVVSRSQATQDGERQVVLYVGHTEDLSQPFAKHRKARDFTRLGANCICLQADKSEESCLAKERDLIAALHPACND